MTIEKPMLPPRRDNPFRLVGGFEAPQEPSRRAAPIETPDDDGYPGLMRGREDVARHIRRHEDARTAYSRAALWAAQAEAENLPPAQIEEARNAALLAGAELVERGRSLVVVLPTDLKGLVDLLMYIEKHFSLLPQEVNGRSLAFSLLRTMRQSLRAVAKYGKAGAGQ
jgi:hypothetical protein